MTTDARFAATEEPLGSPWRASALALSAEAQLLLGNTEEAGTLFVESAAVAVDQGNRPTVILSQAELAVIAMDAARWTEASEHLRLALDTVEAGQLHDYSLIVLAFAAAARLAAHHGDHQQADRHLRQAMRGRPSCTFVLPFIAVRVRLQLAKAYVALDDRGTARHLLREIDDILLRRPALGALVDEVVGVRESLTSSAQTTVVGGPRSVRRSSACSPTCRPTSRSSRSESGCSCLATPSARKWARSTASSASRRGARRWNGPRRSAWSASTPRAGWCSS